MGRVRIPKINWNFYSVSRRIVFKFQKDSTNRPGHCEKNPFCLQMENDYNLSAKMFVVLEKSNVKPY